MTRYLLILLLLGGCKYESNEIPLYEINFQRHLICEQSKDFIYLEHHRKMIRNLINENKYDKKDSFWVESENGGYELIYYTIGGYEFKEDGTLFGQKVELQ